VRIGELTKVPSGAHEMALAIDIHLPVTALTQNQPALTRLIERAAAGDVAAFEQIMIHSQQRVLAVTWRILGNEADARDASQEVFLRVYKYLKRFKPEQDFFAWLYGITINVCRDIAKKRQRHQARFTSLTETEEAFAVAADQRGAEEIVQRSQERDLIATALCTLSYKERVAIVLRDIEGLSTDEVARILKSSSTTVRSQISSARKKIRISCRQQMGRKEQS
jgi:RNA polymerase sigma-70 factor, ECF subfamily